MKLGVCLLMLANAEDPLAKEQIPLLKKAGYDYAEVPLARLLDLPEEAVRDYAQRFSDAGIPVEAFNNSIPSRLPIIGPESCTDMLRRYIDRAIQLACILGVKLITMCGPIRDWVPEGFTWEEGFPQYVEFMRTYADAAADHGITLAIEPVNREENGFISTVGEACRVIRSCGRSNITVVVDFYHFFKEHDNWEALLNEYKDAVSHVHYAALPTRTFPDGRDEAQCRMILEPFIKTGYTGRVSIEAYTDNPERELPKACTIVRSVLQ